MRCLNGYLYFFQKMCIISNYKKKKQVPLKGLGLKKVLYLSSGYYGVISFRSPSALVVGRTRTRLRLNKPSARLAKPLFVVKPNL